MKLAALPLQILPAPPLSPAMIDFVLQEAHVEPEAAEKAFGFEFRSLEAGLREYLDSERPR